MMMYKASKKLKSLQLDLTILVGEEKTPFEYHAGNMAQHSAYIDTMLATPMQEQNTRVLTFPDISQEDWMDMIDYLEDPFKTVKLPETDAMRLAPLYKKYQFQFGLSICSRCLQNFVEERLGDMDEYVEVYELAEKLQMEPVQKACISFFQETMSTYEKAIELSVGQLQKLAPITAAHSILLSHAFTTNPDEVLSPLWPQFFLSQTFLKQLIACNLDYRNSYSIVRTGEVILHSKRVLKLP